jgi:hypothetical protein
MSKPSVMLATTLLLLVASAGPARAGEEVIRTHEALQAYQGKYQSATIHRAFAQSPDGAWGWAGGYTSGKFAEEGALRTCRKHVEEGDRDCVVIHVDHEWVRR